MLQQKQPAKVLFDLPSASKALHYFDQPNSNVGPLWEDRYAVDPSYKVLCLTEPRGNLIMMVKSDKLKNCT